MPATIAPDQHASVAHRVEPFERIEVRDPVNLVDIVTVPGEREELVVEGPPAMLERVVATVEDGVLRIRIAGTLGERLRDAVTTSLTRQHLVYRIRARRLREVRTAGLVRVSVDAFGADAPVVTRLEPAPPVMPRRAAPPSP